MGGGNVLNKTNTMCFPCFQPLTCEMFAIAESFNSKVKGGEGTGRGVNDPSFFMFRSAMMFG